MPTVSIIYCLLASGFCVYSCIIPVKPAIAKVRRIFCVSVFNLYFLSLAAYFAALAPLCVSLSGSGPGLPDYTVYKIGYNASANNIFNLGDCPVAESKGRCFMPEWKRLDLGLIEVRSYFFP